MPECCEDFICTLALETSCEEGSACIYRSMNLNTVVKQSKIKRHYKNMTNFHGMAYSIIFGWKWNSVQIIRHIFYRTIQNSEN